MEEKGHWRFAVLILVMAACLTSIRMLLAESRRGQTESMSVTLTPQLLEKLAVVADALEKSSGTDWVPPEIEFSSRQQIDLAAKRLDSDRRIQAVLAEQGWSADEYVNAVRELLRTLLLLHTKVAGSAIEMENARVLSELTVPEAPRFFGWAKEHLAPELRGLLRIE